MTELSTLALGRRWQPPYGPPTNALQRNASLASKGLFRGSTDPVGRPIVQPSLLQNERLKMTQLPRVIHWIGRNSCTRSSTFQECLVRRALLFHGHVALSTLHGLIIVAPASRSRRGEVDEREGVQPKAKGTKTLEDEAIKA